MLEKEGENDGLVSVESAKWVSTWIVVFVDTLTKYRAHTLEPSSTSIIWTSLAGSILRGTNGQKSWAEKSNSAPQLFTLATSICLRAALKDRPTERNRSMGNPETKNDSRLKRTLPRTQWMPPRRSGHEYVYPGSSILVYYPHCISIKLPY